MDMRGFSRFLGIAKLLPRLGLTNIFRVARHRVLLKLRIHPVCRLKAEIVAGSFFQEVVSSRNLLASQAWQGTLKYFDWFEVPVPVGGKPNWFSKPFSGGADWPSDGPWWKPDTSVKNTGDIKEIWDLSRFNWVLAMAQRAANGDNAELHRLNEWLRDWSEKNPPYMGPNWGCGQEASIRVMHLAIAAVILEQDKSPSPPVLSFIRAHLARIASTLSYALSQDNNHGVLEASGLFVGGEWLYAVSKDAHARKWADLGRKWLEERARRLISPDGGFSMYSVAYHREFLDALTISEFWRQRFELASFSPLFRERAKEAALWLKAFTHPATGDTPNIGANDGTRLLPLTDTEYRDFRPSVQMACILFTGRAAYDQDGPWNLPLVWLGVQIPKEILPSEESRLFDDCGFAVLRVESGNGDYQAFVRYPRFRFRPSHADVLHFDFWIDGVNILRDGGSYSYASALGALDYFIGTESHNTFQFDDRDQMPRFSTFLLGSWLELAERSNIQNMDGEVAFSAKYSDDKSSVHERKINLMPEKLTVCDSVGGFSKKAVLRWRLVPGDWKVLDNVAVNGRFRLEVCSSVTIKRFEIINGFESRGYWQKTQLEVLEVEIDCPGIVTTIFRW